MKMAIIVSMIVLSFLLISCTTKTNNQLINQSLPGALENKSDIQTPIIPGNVTANENPDERTVNVTEKPASTASACEQNLTQQCKGPSELSCIGKPSLDLKAKTITFLVKNNVGSEINLQGLEWFIEDQLWHCITMYPVNSTEISTDDSNFVDIGSSSAIAPDQTFYVKIKLSKLDTSYVDQGFDLTYLGSNDQKNIAYFRITALG